MTSGISMALKVDSEHEMVLEETPTYSIAIAATLTVAICLLMKHKFKKVPTSQTTCVFEHSSFGRFMSRSCVRCQKLILKM